MEGVRGSDRDENRFNPVVKLVLKIFGGGLGASSLGVLEDSLSIDTAFPLLPGLALEGAAAATEWTERRLLLLSMDVHLS